MVPSEKENTNDSVKYPPEINFSPKEQYGVDISPCKNNSTYREDYQGTSTKRPHIIVFEPDFNDIIAGPYIDPLLPDSRLVKQPDPSKWESCDSLYKKFTEKYPCLKKKTLTEEVEQSKVISEYDNLGLSVYQVEFGKGQELGSEQKFVPRTRKKLTLPDAWEIPQSIQRTSYRNLTKMKEQNLISFDMKTKSFLPPPTELGFTREEQEVLQTTTGETEYQEYYSNCGRDVMDHAYYGEIKPLPREFMPTKNKENSK